MHDEAHNRRASVFSPQIFLAIAHHAMLLHFIGELLAMLR